MKIRPVQDKDYAEMARMLRATIRHVNARDYDEETIKAWSARPSAARFRRGAHKCKTWVAVENGKIVGFVNHGNGGEFGALYVHKDHVGRGIGGRLLEVAEDSLKKQGVELVRVESTLTAKDFYEKHGYKVIKKGFHTFDDERLPIWVMEKEL